MKRIALVGCGKEKGDKPFELARDRYKSQLFRAALAHAEAGAFDGVHILSAKSGLLDLTDPVRLYDYSLEDADDEGRASWAHRVMCWQLQSTYRGEVLALTVFAGALYADPLKWQLPEFAGWTVDEPLAGLGIGDRLSWFKTRRAA